jgi:glycine oxidase
MELKDDKVIVGWGLAGSVLAWQFYLKGVGFQVNDSGVNWSTRTAAGLVNPIVFKRMTKSWNADLLMPYAEEFYSKIEQILGVQLISRRPIFRVFASTAEENDWSAKQGDDRFKAYLSTQSTTVRAITKPF